MHHLLRGRILDQRMADLPADRTEVAPPFTSLGFDVFRPWTVNTRKTRGGSVNSKRWGLVFTCLSSRTIHIEVLESMDASSFICALRRFFALRGPASLLRCDRGTNFIGAKSELDDALGEMNQSRVERYARHQGCKWLFKPPHASHFGGAWERQIGTIRRVLDAMLAQLGSSQLTHELLVTLMAEVTAIVNARPIAAMPTDTDEPQPLSPSMLLTMKTRPLGPPHGNFLPVDLYARRRWRRVQYLADQFWIRWRRDYLQNMQIRSKWSKQQRNLSAGDVVLMKDEEVHRNNWPIGRVTEAIKSGDGQVRKAQVEIVREGKKKTFLRPIKELILLVPAALPTIPVQAKCLAVPPQTSKGGREGEDSRERARIEHPWARSVTLTNTKNSSFAQRLFVPFSLKLCFILKALANFTSNNVWKILSYFCRNFVSDH